MGRQSVPTQRVPRVEEMEKRHLGPASRSMDSVEGADGVFRVTDARYPLRGFSGCAWLDEHGAAERAQG